MRISYYVSKFVLKNKPFPKNAAIHNILLLPNMNNMMVYRYTMVYSSKTFFLFQLTNSQTSQLQVLLVKSKIQ